MSSKYRDRFILSVCENDWEGCECLYNKLVFRKDGSWLEMAKSDADVPTVILMWLFVEPELRGVGRGKRSLVDLGRIADDLGFNLVAQDTRCFELTEDVSSWVRKGMHESAKNCVEGNGFWHTILASCGFMRDEMPEYQMIRWPRGA